MKSLKTSLVVTGAILALCGGMDNAFGQADPNAPQQQGGRQGRQRGGANGTNGANGANAQGGQRGQQGNFDPAARNQQTAARLRDAFEVKDDAEWKLLEERIIAVLDARTAAAAPRGFGRGGPGGPGGAAAGAGGAAGGRQRGGAPGGTVADADLEALQKAIEDKAPADEIKAKLAKYRDSHKSALAKLSKAQEDLKNLLTPKQEAIAVVAGLLS